MDGMNQVQKTEKEILSEWITRIRIHAQHNRGKYGRGLGCVEVRMEGGRTLYQAMSRAVDGDGSLSRKPCEKGTLPIRSPERLTSNSETLSR